MDLRIEKYYAQLLPRPDAMGYADASDGTRLAWRQFGTHSDKPALLCCNGIGCSVLFWRYLVEAFSHERAVILWDYRGHGLSQNPMDFATAGVEDCADDAATVLHDVGCKEAIFLGHSMGAQVIFEAYRRYPHKILGLVPVLGAFSRPLSTFLDSEIPGQVFPVVSQLTQAFPAVVSAGSRVVAALPVSHHFAGLMGLINHKLVSIEDFEAYLAHITRLDPGFFMRLAERAAVHDAAEVLAGIEVPTLVVAGQWDLFTPGWISEAMHKRIPDSEMLMIPGGTHTALIEQPELFHLRLEKLFARIDGQGTKSKTKTTRSAKN